MSARRRGRGRARGCADTEMAHITRMVLASGMASKVRIDDGHAYVDKREPGAPTPRWIAIGWMELEKRLKAKGTV
jgi:hypothetical protein